jgi:hypothetical protein
MIKTKSVLVNRIILTQMRSVPLSESLEADVWHLEVIANISDTVTKDIPEVGNTYHAFRAPTFIDQLSPLGLLLFVFLTIRSDCVRIFSEDG